MGDEVICCTPFQDMGTIAEYALTKEKFLARKPRNLSHNQAAALPLVGLTALDALDKAGGEIEGKTVLVQSAREFVFVLDGILLSIRSGRSRIDSLSAGKECFWCKVAHLYGFYGQGG